MSQWMIKEPTPKRSIQFSCLHYQSSLLSRGSRHTSPLLELAVLHLPNILSLSHLVQALDDEHVCTSAFCGNNADAFSPQQTIPHPGNWHTWSGISSASKTSPWNNTFAALSRSCSFAAFASLPSSGQGTNSFIEIVGKGIFCSRLGWTICNLLSGIHPSEIAKHGIQPLLHDVDFYSCPFVCDSKCRDRPCSIKQRLGIRRVAPNFNAKSPWIELVGETIAAKGFHHSTSSIAPAADCASAESDDRHIRVSFLDC